MPCIDGGAHSTYIPPPSEALGLRRLKWLSHGKFFKNLSFISFVYHHTGGFETSRLPSGS
jgi:hypothetical protein